MCCVNTGNEAGRAGVSSKILQSKRLERRRKRHRELEGSIERGPERKPMLLAILLSGSLEPCGCLKKDRVPSPISFLLRSPCPHSLMGTELARVTALLSMKLTLPKPLVLLPAFPFSPGAPLLLCQA